MRRIYDKSDLKAALPAAMTKSEARAATLKDFMKTWGKIQLFIDIMFGVVFGAVAVTAYGWIGAGIGFAMFLMMFWSQYDSRMSYYTHPTTYDDLENHRKEIDDFLKEKGYVAPK